MKIQAYGMSDTGRIREINEDSFYISGFNDKNSDGFIVLADGMGGHNAGEIASGMAVSTITSELEKTVSEESPDKIIYNILSSIDYANKKIFEDSQRDIKKAGMGSTLVVAYAKNSKLYVANIGDSRAYLKSGKSFTQITQDHSIVQELVSRGSITPEEALVHPDKNIITRAMGTERIVEADMFEYSLKSGDLIMLCSDGLSEMVRDNVIFETLENIDDINDAVSALVTLANENGGKDNITVAILKVSE